MMIRLLAALSAGLSAIAGILVAAEGDLVPQLVVLVFVAASAGLSAAVAVLSRPAP